MLRDSTQPPEASFQDDREDVDVVRAHGLDPHAFSDVLRPHVAGHLLAGRAPEPVADVPAGLAAGARLVARGEPLVVVEVTPHFTLLAGASSEFALPTRDLIAAIRRKSSLPPPPSSSEPSSSRMAGFPRGSLWRR